MKLLLSPRLVIQHLLRRSYRTEQYVYGYREPSAAHHAVTGEALDHLTALWTSRRQRPHLWQYISAYRHHGHKVSRINPIAAADRRGGVFELTPSLYIPDGDLGAPIEVSGLLHSGARDGVSSVEELTRHLEEAYCGTLSGEFEHLDDPVEREWFAEALETREERYPVDPNRQIRYAQLMLRGQLVDKFMGSKFTTVKRYSGEGAESLLVCFDEIFRSSAGDGVEAAVIAMAHRGRNNLLTVLLNYPPRLFFRKMRGLGEFPPGCKASGDTFSHFSQSTDLVYPDEGGIHVSLIPNPSHLEANIAVAAGKARSKMQALRDGDYDMAVVSGGEQCKRNGDKVLCIQVHGDGSVAGQGIVQETLAFSQVPHFCVGGSLHVVVNNQLGFTTEADRGRSSRYSTDIAKMTGCPVLHVNGEDPEAVGRAARLAVEFRQRFRRDVFIDLLCYRRWGHNELDDPSLTQPLMYAEMASRRSTPDLYADRLVSDGVCHGAMLDEAVAEWQRCLADELVRVDEAPESGPTFGGQWADMGPSSGEGLTLYNTGMPADQLREWGRLSVALPEGNFQLHPTVKRTFIERRLERLTAGEGLDWATGEALAIASVLAEGRHCRLSGQDVGRGTFSHRHLMLVDQATDAMWVPLNRLDGGGQLELANSILSEEAVLGFEVGMAMDNPRSLLIWEAQFGDFFNGAQIILDTYLSSAETKWMHQCGLVLLLPHGYDGAGPEHSSARLERFLQLSDSAEADRVDSDDVNWHVIQPTSGAQYFHALRRQVVRPFRKPLIVLTPKALLRAPEISFSLAEVGPGTHFRHLIPDPRLAPGTEGAVERVILCSGKHYFTLDQYRQERLTDEAQRAKIALIRVEQLSPFPLCELAAELRRFPRATRFVWSQEEARNMGAWQFVNSRVANLLGLRLDYAGRAELAAPAVGIGQLHRAEVDSVLSQTFDKMS